MRWSIRFVSFVFVAGAFTACASGAEVTSTKTVERDPIDEEEQPEDGGSGGSGGSAGVAGAAAGTTSKGGSGGSAGKSGAAGATAGSSGASGSAGSAAGTGGSAGAAAGGAGSGAGGAAGKAGSGGTAGKGGAGGSGGTSSSDVSGALSKPSPNTTICGNEGKTGGSCAAGLVCRIYSPTDGRCEGCSPCNGIGEACTASVQCAITAQCFGGFCRELCSLAADAPPCVTENTTCQTVGNDAAGVCLP